MFAGLFELLFPRSCCACGARPAAGPFCGDCSCRLEVPPQWRCPRCGGPIALPPALRGLAPGADERPAPCAACEAAAYDSIRAPFVHGGAASEAVHRLKYRGRREIARLLAPLLATAARSCALAADVIAPIPLHPLRRRERGYDQAALLARALAGCLGLRHDERLLERLRPTTQQVGLDRPARLRNLEGAFRAAPRAEGRRVLLVDDVVTTGATAGAAASALRDAGAHAVHVIAVARAGF